MNRMPSVAEIVAVHDLKLQSAVGQAQHKLFQQYGLEALLPLLIAAFPFVRSAFGRHSILFWMPRFARTHADVVNLAQGALRDRSFLVRSEACGVLAYSLRDDAVPALEQLLTHRDAKTRDCAEAAIDAITSKNHHHYLDRKHTGSRLWLVNPGD